MFNFDSISMIMLVLIAFIGACIGSFAVRYMKGDKHYSLFFFYLVLLLASLGVMVSADHLAILFGAWCTSNIFLVRLMIHKSSWRAAKNSGLLAAKNYLFGAFFMAVSFICIYLATGESSIQTIVQTEPLTPVMGVALFCLLIAAMTQSAIWPFHRWLISSLNSPTPVSAIMHAGLINGGGFLLVRFAPLYLDHPFLLKMIFIIGMLTALIGTFWKLLQSDVKRMLACSTMGQMGFMLAQCGLGLFPAAIAHLVTHGMLKAYLFLSSGSAAQEKRYDLSHSLKFTTIASALMCGLFGSFCFAMASGKSWGAGDTTFVLMVIAFIAAVQSALPVLSLKVYFRLPLAICITGVMSFIYGFTIHLLTNSLESMTPQPLSVFYLVPTAILVLAWLAVLIFTNNKKIDDVRPWMMKRYVAALNASQPHPDTITAHRNQYKYL